MKKLLFLSIAICFFSFTQNVNAQSFGDLKNKTSVLDKTSKYKALLDKPEVQEKVKKQLVKNTSLRDKAINFLKNDPGVKNKVLGLFLN